MKELDISNCPSYVTLQAALKDPIFVFEWLAGVLRRSPGAPFSFSFYSQPVFILVWSGTDLKLGGGITIVSISPENYCHDRPGLKDALGKGPALNVAQLSISSAGIYHAQHFPHSALYKLELILSFRRPQTTTSKLPPVLNNPRGPILASIGLLREGEREKEIVGE